MMISGVVVKKLRLIPDGRGYLMEILRADDSVFSNFGQVYITTVYPGIIKGWHYHKIQTDMLTVVSGMAKIALYDDRPDSPTYDEVNEFFVGPLNPQLIVVPPGVLHGFVAVGLQMATLLNCPTHPYNYENPDEHRVPPHGVVPYTWETENG